MKLLHFHHRARHHLRKRSNIRLFEGSVLFHVFARSLVDVFIPILLLQHGYSLVEVLWYCVLFLAIDVPMNFVAERAIRRTGARRAVLVGTAASIGFLLVLANLSPHSWPMLAVLAFFSAVYDGFYWVGHLYIFAQAEEKEGDASEDTGALTAVRIMGGMLGPIVGGALLVFDNQRVLIAASILFLLLSLVPLFVLRIKGDRPAGEHVPFRAFFTGARERYNYGGLCLFSLNDPAEAVLWPLFIYVTFGSIESVALLAVIVSFASAGTSYAAGKFSRFHPKSMIAVGSLLIACTWIVRMAVPHPLVYYASLVAVGFFALITNIPMEGDVLRRAKETEPLSAMTYRNAATMLPQIPFFLAVILLVDVFRVGFVTAAASMLALSAISVAVLRNERSAARSAGGSRTA